MGYRRAEEILPIEIIQMIQQYIEGENIYIPKKTENRNAWGSATHIRQELLARDRAIFDDYLQGAKAAWLADKYCLSEKSIQRIVRKMKGM